MKAKQLREKLVAVEGRTSGRQQPQDLTVEMFGKLLSLVGDVIDTVAELEGAVEKLKEPVPSSIPLNRSPVDLMRLADDLRPHLDRVRGTTTPEKT